MMKQTTFSFKRILGCQTDSEVNKKRPKIEHDDDIIMGSKEEWDLAKVGKTIIDEDVPKIIESSNVVLDKPSRRRRKLPWLHEKSESSLANPHFKYRPDLIESKEEGLTEFSQIREKQPTIHTESESTFTKLDYKKSTKSRSSIDRNSFYEYSKSHQKLTTKHYSETRSAASKLDTEDYPESIESTTKSVKKTSLHKKLTTVADESPEEPNDDQVSKLFEDGYIEEMSSDELEEIDLQNEGTATSQRQKGYVVAFPKSQYSMPHLTKNSLFIICYIHQFLIQMSKQTKGAFRHMGSFIREAGIEVVHMIIVRSIPTVVYSIFDNSMQWTIQQLLEIIKTPYDISSGVYMDVMTDSAASDWFRLYVGSACSHLTKGPTQKGLKGRISQHLSPAYRVNKGGLHYRILNESKSRKSNYGVLAKFPGIWGDDALPWTRMTEQIFGNLFSVLQTPDFRLPGILDVSNASLRGKGLNIAPVHFQKAADRRQTGSSFQALKHSDDPTKRKYYWDMVVRGTKTATANRNKIVRDNANDSGLMKVRVIYQKNKSPRGQIHVHGVMLCVSADQVRRYRIEDDDMVNVTYDRVSTGRHPNIFANASRPNDPAYSLGIKISGQYASGQTWSTWLTGSGETMPMKMNTITDFLDNIPQEESNALPRRFIRGTRKSAATYS